MTFAPTSEGSKTATLSIAHNAAGSPSRLSLTGIALRKPIIAYRPDRLSFGNATPGVTVKLPIMLYNRGNDLLSVASITSGKVVWNRVTGGQQAIQADIRITVTSKGGLPGDFNADGKVDFDDFFLFAAAFGGKDAQFDLDGDSKVDFNDFFVFADAFGK